MKAITLWQPWASLLALGLKHETRSWATSYRGPMAIHAGKILCHRFSCEVDGSIFAPAVNAALWPGVDFPDVTCERDTWEELPRRAVIGIGDLAECYKIVDAPEQLPSGDWAVRVFFDNNHRWKDIQITNDDLLFGDWTPGRHAWEFANTKLLPEPIPARGKQGLWDWRPET